VCEPHWDRAIDNYKHYLGRLDVGNTSENQYPFTSKMTIPVSYEIVETVLPRIIGKDPEFTPVAIEPSDVPYENTARIAIDMEYNNPKLELLGEPIYLKLVKGVKEALITGNAVWRAFWRREGSKRVVYTASLDRSGHKDADVQEVLKVAKELKAENEIRYGKKFVDSPFLDDFDIKLVPFFHFFPDVSFSEPGRMRYQIERYWMTPDELFEEAEAFSYDKAQMDEIKRMIDEKKMGFTPEIGKDFLQRYNDLFANLNNDTFSNDDDRIPLLIVDKMWENGETVHVIVNEKYVLTGEKGMPNPYNVKKNPFIFSNDVTIPHSYFSRGEIDAIKKLEDGVTDIFNMRFDNLIQSMLNFWLVNKNFIAEGDEFVPIPNTITSVTDVDRAVRVISGKDVTATAYKEAEELMALIKNISGTQDYVKGEEGQTLAGRTYGGMRLVQEMANARFIVKSRLFEKMALKALGYFILEFSRQFINNDRVSRIIGETGDMEEKNLKAADLKTIKGFMDIKVIPNSSMVIDQQAEALKMNAIADRFLTQKGPFSNIPEEVYDKFLLKYLLAYGITDAVYWVRARRKARLEQEAANKNMAKKEQPQGGVPNEGVPNVPGLPSMDVMQSDQVASQPSPLSQLLNAQQLPPVEQIQ
jgi:hypothetical protein